MAKGKNYPSWSLSGTLSGVVSAYNPYYTTTTYGNAYKGMYGSIIAYQAPMEVKKETPKKPDVNIDEMIEKEWNELETKKTI